MELTVVVLLLAAALLHSAWHAMIKASGDRLVGLAGMNVVSAGVSLAVLPLVSVPRLEVWPVLAFSVLLHNVYKGGLAQVYRKRSIDTAIDDGEGDEVMAKPIGSLPNTRAEGLRSRRQFGQWGVC